MIPPARAEARFKKSRQFLEEPSLHFRCKAFGPEGPTYKERKRLRKLLVDDLEKAIQTSKTSNEGNGEKVSQPGESLLIFSQKERRALLRPGMKPQSLIASISISHCQVSGGFVFSLNKKISPGFDMEQSHRVSRKVISRISTREEIRQTPDRSLLWTAKEAVFKCAIPDSADKNPLLRDMLISKWKQMDTEDWLFHFQVKNSPVKGRGAAFLMDGLAFSCSLLLTSF